MFFDKILIFSDRISELLWIKAIRKSFFALFPFILFGSLALVVTNFPVVSYQQAMLREFGTNWKVFAELLTNLTFGLLGLLLSGSVGYFTAILRTEKVQGINPGLAPLISMLSFLIIAVNLQFHPAEEWLRVDTLNQSNILLAIMSSIISAELFVFLLTVQKKKGWQWKHNPDADLKNAFEVLLPTFLTLIAFMLLRGALIAADIPDINQFLSEVLTSLFRHLHNPLLTGVCFTVLSQILWFFGLHGNNILFPIINGLFVDNLHANIAAVATDGVPPHIITKPFMDSFTMLGGSGATFCLLIAIFLSYRHKNSLRLAKLSLLPSLFNVNELVTFGLPIVLNPIFIIPFILVPVIMLLIAYLATAIGFMPRSITDVQWTIPIFLSGYKTTMSWHGVMIQAINLSVGTALYFPFLRLHHIKADNDFQKEYDRLVHLVQHQPTTKKLKLLKRRDILGQIACSLADEMEIALAKGEFFLVYQPLVNNQDQITCFEALLRWKHTRFGLIPPSLFITIAEESGQIHSIGLKVLEMATQQLAQWQQQGAKNLRVSINLSPLQLKNPQLPFQLTRLLQQTEIHPAAIDLEITEGLELGTDEITDRVITALSDLGLKLAIDDFGMGHTSLLYLRRYHFSKVKIDGSLIRNIDQEKHCQDIVSALVHLAVSQNFTVVAEYIERLQQQQILGSLGCHEYQGYLISEPLAADDCWEFIQKH